MTFILLVFYFYMQSSIDGVGGESVIKSLEDVAPDVGKYIIEFAFGDIYPRKELSLQLLRWIIHFPWQLM